jgi:hypothetical protein
MATSLKISTYKKWKGYLSILEIKLLKYTNKNLELKGNLSSKIVLLLGIMPKFSLNLDIILNMVKILFPRVPGTWSKMMQATNKI